VDASREDQAPSLQRNFKQLQELYTSQCLRAPDLRAGASCGNLINSSDVIIMPVGDQDQIDGSARINPNLIKIREACRPIGPPVVAGIDDNPPAPGVNGNTFAEARTKN
jgi:hypothetical protein